MTQPAALFAVNEKQVEIKKNKKTSELISHSVDVAPQVKAENIVQNISVIDGYMVIVFALGIIQFRVNSHIYHLKLDLKGEL